METLSSSAAIVSSSSSSLSFFSPKRKDSPTRLLQFQTSSKNSTIKAVLFRLKTNVIHLQSRFIIGTGGAVLDGGSQAVSVYIMQVGATRSVLVLPVTESSTAESTEASCLSSTSSAASSARSSYYLTRSGMGRDQLEVHEKPKRGKMQSIHGSGSAYLRCQAEAILKLLSRSSSSEVRIRQQLGDSPDTSKALRIWRGGKKEWPNGTRKEKFTGRECCKK